MDDPQRDQQSIPPLVETPPAQLGVPAGPSQPMPTPVPTPIPYYAPPPGYPPYPGAPSMPLPGAEAGTMPTYPGYPGSPSMPLYGTPASPSYPLYPGMPVGPSIPGYPASASDQSAKQLKAWLAQPFPLWLSMVAGAVAAVAVLIAFFAGELVASMDWADGASLAGGVALGVAFLALIAVVVRLIAGRRGLAMALLSATLLLLLIATGIGGLTLTTPLHSLQAQTLEHTGGFQAAVHEYGLAGEEAPNAPNIARVYAEWGEDLLNAGKYADAVARFTTVTSTYSASTSAVTRANRDLFTAYSKWVRAATSDVPYNDAIAFFGTYVASAACDSACQTDEKAIEPQARFQYGTLLASQSRFSDAAAQFETIQKDFAQSSYAAQAHTSAAKAYLALGQQQKGTECSSAIPTYQTLAKSYADTAEGKQATSDLAAPQAVSGTVTGRQNGESVMILAKTIDQVNHVFSDDIRAPLDPTTGKYAFTAVEQGSYYVLLGTTGGGFFLITQGGQPMKRDVGPLCPTTIDINLA